MKKLYEKDFVSLASSGNGLVFEVKGKFDLVVILTICIVSLFLLACSYLLVVSLLKIKENHAKELVVFAFIIGAILISSCIFIYSKLEYFLPYTVSFQKENNKFKLTHQSFFKKKVYVVDNFSIEEKNNLIKELLETQNYVSPLVNIYETENEFVLSADMPGVLRKDLKVKVDNDLLVMFGRIDYENEISKNYILNEQELGNYYRTFRISDSVDQNKIEAKYDNGKLVVNLPKSEKVKPRTINIL